MDGETQEVVAEPIADIEERAYRALLRSLGWLCNAEVWKYTKCSRHKGGDRDRLLLSRMKTKEALQLLEIRKTASTTLARLLAAKNAVQIPLEVPASGPEKLEKILDDLDAIDNFEDLDAEVKRIQREGEISRVDADAILQDARERFGLEVSTEDEHTVEDEVGDLMDAALLQAASAKPANNGSQ